jgi:LEA14-like dessication related protein
MRNWIVAGLLGLAMTGSACSSLGKQLIEGAAVTQLTYAFDGVELKRADVPLLAQNPSADLQINLQATNPNAVNASLDNMTFDLFLEGSKVGTGTLANKLAVPANSTAKASVLVTVPYTGLPTAAMSAILARKANFTLRGSSAISTPLGNIPVPFELQKTLTF